MQITLSFFFFNIIFLFLLSTFVSAVRALQTAVRFWKENSLRFASTNGPLVKYVHNTDPERPEYPSAPVNNTTRGHQVGQFRLSSTGWEIVIKIIKHWSLKKVVNGLAWDQNVTKWKYRHLLSLKITAYFTCLKQIQLKIRLPCELFCLLQSSLWIKWQLSKILWGYVHFAQYFQGY